MINAEKDRAGKNLISTFCKPKQSASLAIYRNKTEFAAVFFNSTTKPGAPSADIELLAAAKAKINLPIVAIGGVTLDNAPTLIAHGASMVAVVHGLFSADSAAEVERRARAFSALFISN